MLLQAYTASIATPLQPFPPSTPLLSSVRNNNKLVNAHSLCTIQAFQSHLNRRHRSTNHLPHSLSEKKKKHHFVIFHCHAKTRKNLASLSYQFQTMNHIFFWFESTGRDAL